MRSFDTQLSFTWVGSAVGWCEVSVPGWEGGILRAEPDGTRLTVYAGPLPVSVDAYDFLDLLAKTHARAWLGEQRNAIVGVGDAAASATWDDGGWRLTVHASPSVELGRIYADPMRYDDVRFLGGTGDSVPLVEVMSLFHRAISTLDERSSFSDIDDWAERVGTDAELALGTWVGPRRELRLLGNSEFVLKSGPRTFEGRWRPRQLPSRPLMVDFVLSSGRHRWIAGLADPTAMTTDTGSKRQEWTRKDQLRRE